MKYHVNQVNRIGNRKKNQDRVAIVESMGEVLMILADGLGGHQGGEIASQKCVDTFIDEFSAAEKPCPDPKAFLAKAGKRAHDEIVGAGVKIHPPVDPRTTCVACYIQAGVAWWMHIGDSRLYVFREQQPIFRTLDHSFVEQLFQDGIINALERANHPKKNAITRCLGGPVKPEFEFGEPMNLVTGDCIIMCSDGLWDPLDHHGIGAFLDDGDFTDAIEKMAHEAEKVAHPKSDNISVAGFRFISLSDEEARQEDQAGAQPAARAQAEEHDQGTSQAALEAQNPESAPAAAPPATEKPQEEDLDDAIAQMKASIAEYRRETANSKS